MVPLASAVPDFFTRAPYRRVLSVQEIPTDWRAANTVVEISGLLATDSLQGIRKCIHPHNVPHVGLVGPGPRRVATSSLDTVPASMMLEAAFNPLKIFEPHSEWNGVRPEQKLAVHSVLS